MQFFCNKPKVSLMFKNEKLWGKLKEAELHLMWWTPQASQTSLHGSKILKIHLVRRAHSSGHDRGRCLTSNLLKNCSS